MVMYRHVNKGHGIITIYDSKGIGYTLRPGEEVSINRRAEGNGVVVEQIEKKSRSSKKEEPLKELEKLKEDDE